jgi:magnesium-transporting ATPase (P-type)
MAAARKPSEEVALLINEPIEAEPVRKKSPDYGTRPKEAQYEPEAHGNDPLILVQKSEGLTTEQAKELLKQYGKNQLPEKTVSKWYLFFSLLWQPMPIMIWIAAAVEIVLKNYMDAGILIGINMANACLSFYETTKAGDAVAALKVLSNCILFGSSAHQ